MCIRDSLYPYDIAPGAEATGDGHPDEESLRGSSEVVAARIREELQSKVQEAGLEILQVRITHLALSLIHISSRGSLTARCRRPWQP